jgi:putative PIN family toxin of toxin-antitoxin system
LRVILDTSVKLRGMMNPLSTWGQVIRRSSEYSVITSLDIDDEFDRVFGTQRLQDRLSRFASTEEFSPIRAVFDDAELIESPPPVRICRDADDDKFFACAAAGRVDYIVSEDDDILAIPEYKGARTVRAADFLRILDAAR